MALKTVGASPTNTGVVINLVNSSSEADIKVVSIKDRVLQTIRNTMPITALFTPELKINLETFVKDQILICRIAELIAAFQPNRPIDAKAVEAYFGTSELVGEISALFTDPAPFLTLLYEACADVLNQKPYEMVTPKAIEGRIFTLKNALIAQHNPKAIYLNQKTVGLKPQEIPVIKAEGVSFIRHSLSMHLNTFKKVENSSFQASLLHTAEQLIPFVRKITTMYLSENGYRCEVDPMAFRNIHGYNQAGLIAAIVIEACLSALGYKTRVMARIDLEPRVNLLTRHSIVEVTDCNGTRYLVDPTYLQFHLDVCVEQSEIPTSSVLVLNESEVDDYIEKYIMVHWKSHQKRVYAGDKIFIQALDRQDQLLPFTIKNYESALPKERTPSNVEEWVRNAFKRVWGISTYTPVACVSTFQAIFNGVEKVQKTFNTVKSMNIASMTHHLSYSDVEKKLGQLKNTTPNSNEVVALMAQIPSDKQKKYLSLLDVDPRLNNQVRPSLNAYFRSLKKVVNADSRDLCALYGCSGGDCTSILLATDASHLIFADMTDVSLTEFKTALSLLKSRTPSSEKQISQKLEESRFYTGRELYIGATSAYDGKHKMDDVALKLLFELRELGVDLDQVTLSSAEGGITIDFSWQYHGDVRCRKRSLTFVTADITRPDSYPSLLKAKLQEGIDIFYMKGACCVPELYPQFLPTIAQSMMPGGWLMTTDKTSNMESVDPEPSLKQHALIFSTVKTEEIRLLEDLSHLESDPFATVPVLQMFPEKHQRFLRTPGTDLSYWSFLTLRQKAST